MRSQYSGPLDSRGAWPCFNTSVLRTFMIFSWFHIQQSPRTLSQLRVLRQTAFQTIGRDKILLLHPTALWVSVTGSLPRGVFHPLYPRRWAPEAIGGTGTLSLTVRSKSIVVVAWC